MHKIIITAILACAVPQVVAASNQSSIWDGVTFYTEEYAPYNYSEGGEVKGISVELLTKVAETMGEPIDTGLIKVMPWARSYHNVLTTKNTVLFSTARAPSREGLFRWAGPIASVRIVLLSRKDAKVKIENNEQLKNYRIGVIINDIGERLVLEHGVPEKNIETAYSTTALLRMLEHGRIDLLAYDELVTKRSIRNIGYKPEDFSVSFLLGELDLYFAFNRETSGSLIESFQAALNELKSTDNEKMSIYEKIMSQYKIPSDLIR